MTDTVQSPTASTHDTHIAIQIDRKHRVATKTPMTGAELKHLGEVGPDRDLFLEVPGHGDDELIADTQSVDLQAGMHFFSAPHDLNPGA